MKILILTNDDIGLYLFRWELIEELIKDNRIIISAPKGERIEAFVKMGCGFIETPIDRRGINPITDLKLFFHYLRIVKAEKPDLIISYTIKPNVYGGLACRIMRVPYAANITGLGTAFQKKGLLRNLVILMYKVGLKNAKVVFFENRGNQNIFISLGIVHASLTCLLMGAGVNLKKYDLAPYPSGDCVKFLFMGRVMQEKGVDELFAVMKKLRSKGVNCSLDVLGYYEENYKNKIAQYEAEGWLHYYGFQNDVKPYITSCHCFVLPSWHEGMANTNLECAAMGRPVITSKIYGCMEAVEDEVSGYLCERKNADSLYQAMKRFTELSYEERKTMGEAGRRRMEERFDKKAVVRTTVQRLNAASDYR